MRGVGATDDVVTPDRARVVAEVRQLVNATPLAELPEILGQLEAERLRGLMRIHAPLPFEAPAPADDTERLLTMQEVAQRLGVSLEHARELGRRGELATVRVGERYVRVRRAALDVFVARREAAGGSLRISPAPRLLRAPRSYSPRTSARGALSLPALEDLDPRQRRRPASLTTDGGPEA